MEKTKELIKIALVEDDLYYNKAMQKYLETICNGNTYPQFSFQIDSFLYAHDCIENMDDDVDIMILDYFFINEEESDVLTALDVIKELQKCNPSCKVILVSAQQSAQTTVALMKTGIYEYIDKSVNNRNRIGSVIHTILSKRAS